MPEKKGLTPKQHGELNVPREVFDGGKEAKIKRITELRQVYAGNPLAQKEIDIYDVDSEYNIHIVEYRESITDGNKNKQKELEKWFEQYNQEHS